MEESCLRRSWSDFVSLSMSEGSVKSWIMRNVLVSMGV